MKIISTGKWHISGDGMPFSDAFYSREEALKLCQETFIDGCIGESVTFKFEESDIEGYCTELIDVMGNQIFRETGNPVDCWRSSIEGDQNLDLAKVFSAVLIKYLNDNHLQPSDYEMEVFANLEAVGNGKN